MLEKKTYNPINKSQLYKGQVKVVRSSPLGYIGKITSNKRSKLYFPYSNLGIRICIRKR